MIHKFIRYYHTLKYLRWEQIAYRIFYFARARWRKLIGFNYSNRSYETFKTSGLLRFDTSISAYEMIKEHNSFSFLNLNKTFDDKIDWEYAEFGKLWTYNLNYFEFLLQENMSSTEGVTLIKNYIQEFPNLKTAKEPFPTSLRLIFWIRFLIKNKIQDQEIDKSLYQQAHILADNLEYHLLGNHLLENGFGLLFASYYFHDDFLYKKAKKILLLELKEQILKDGGHFELCPMYHCIILYRVLDCLNLVKNNPTLFNQELKMLLSQKASVMLGWLKNMQFADGSLPRFGDSTDGIAPTTNSLFQYAQRLKIEITRHPLSDSGYRKLKNTYFELVAKVGAIAPDYIPGHAHADSLSFELHVNGKPFIVDTGISTYEKNERRQLERSTQSHNTVEINNQNSSDVWGGFRVGKRAKTRLLREDSEIVAEHDGYAPVKNKRAFRLDEKTLRINDFIESTSGTFYLHFPSSIECTSKDKRIDFEGVSLKFNGSEQNTLVPFQYPLGYNLFTNSNKAIIFFKNKLETIIQIN